MCRGGLQYWNTLEGNLFALGRIPHRVIIGRTALVIRDPNTLWL